jgi:hypothetical protein
MSEENVDLLDDMLSRWNGGERTFADEIQHDAEILSRGHMEGRSLRGLKASAAGFVRITAARRRSLLRSASGVALNSP